MMYKKIKVSFFKKRKIVEYIYLRVTNLISITESMTQTIAIGINWHNIKLKKLLSGKRKNNTIIDNNPIDIIVFTHFTLYHMRIFDIKLKYARIPEYQTKNINANFCQTISRWIKDNI